MPIHGMGPRRGPARHLGLLLALAALVMGVLTACASSAGAGETGTGGTAGAGNGGVSSTTSTGESGAPGGGSSTSGRPAPIIYRPPGLSMASKVPLVIALYGTFGSPQDMEGLSHFEAVAAQHGFVVAYLGSSDPTHPWKPPSDLNYISAMIDQITASQNIDPQRVYVTGFSAGGYETWRAGCQLSTKVAAIAIVSGAMNQALYDSCSPKRPISQLLIVGTADGTRWTGIRGRLPSAVQTTARWRAIDGCGASQPAMQHVSVVAQQTWSNCTDGSAVGLYAIPGAHHVWPPYGVGAPTNYPTSQEIWSFFEAHPGAPLSLPSSDVRLTSLRVKQQGKARSIVVRYLVRVPSISLKLGLANHTYGFRLGLGSKQAVLRIPVGLHPRRYPLTLAIVDSYGRSLTSMHTVRLPALPAH